MDQEASRMAVAVVPPKRVWYRPSRVPRMHTWPDHQNARRRGQGTRRGREGKAEEVREPGSGSVNETLSDHKPTIDDTSEQLYHAWTTCCRHPKHNRSRWYRCWRSYRSYRTPSSRIADAAPAQELPSAGRSAGRQAVSPPASPGHITMEPLLSARLRASDLPRRSARRATARAARNHANAAPMRTSDRSMRTSDRSMRKRATRSCDPTSSTALQGVRLPCRLARLTRSGVWSEISDDEYGPVSQSGDIVLLHGALSLEGLVPADVQQVAGAAGAAKRSALAASSAPLRRITVHERHLPDLVERTCTAARSW
jgi:hypothetical protein